MDNRFIGLDGFEEIEAVPGAKIQSKKGSKGKPMHAGYEVREHKIVKKKVVLAAVTSMAAVVLSCATVASALSGSGENNNEATKPAETQPALVTSVDEAAATPAEAQLQAENKLYGLYIDGELVGVTTNKAALEKALEGMVGASYEPVACLGTQVVAGTNYCYLAVSDTGFPELVYLYADLEGNVSVSDCRTWEHGSFTTPAE